LVPVTTAISILGLLWFRSPPSRSASRSAWELVDDWLPLTVLSRQTRVAPREREYGQKLRPLRRARPDRRCVPGCRALGQRRPGNGSDLPARRHRLQAVTVTKAETAAAGIAVFTEAVAIKETGPKEPV